MVKPSGAVAGTLLAALLLTACGTEPHRQNSPWAAGCARAEAQARVFALQVGPFVGVTTQHDVVAAVKKRHTLGPKMAAAWKAIMRTTFTGPVTSSKVVRFPPPVAREIHKVFADLDAFYATFGAVGGHHRPPAIGGAAQKTMRDIQAIQATCSQKH